jgi:pyridoxal phosphate-dependent aminotransferase EpsN
MGKDELTLVQDAFATNWIAPLGPHVDQFEREFAELIGKGQRAKSEGRGGQTAESAKGKGQRAKGEGQRAALTSTHLPLSGEASAPSAAVHAAALSSGTAALHLAMRWLKLQPGDEVICSSLTFSASVNPVLYERATPVFVDCDDISWNMAPALLAEAVEDRIKRGKKPKAVILVHLYGQSADIDPIAATCEKHGIPLIEDAAEALGAVYYGPKAKPETGNLKPEGQTQTEVFRSMTSGLPSPSQVSGFRSQVSAQRGGIAPGSVGLCGVHSFNGNKIITTSGGGMLTSSDPKLIEKARFWATQARDPAPHYQHSEIGFNYRMSNVLAVIGRGQLRVLEDRVNARRRNCAFYEQAFKDLPGVAFMPEADFNRCTRWLTCITVDPKVAGTDREKIRLALEKENIEARPVWKPMHLQPIFKDCAVYGGAVSERLFENGLCLPSGSNLTTADLERVVEAVRKVFNH